LIIWLIFFLFLQTKPQFLPSVCLVPAEHFCCSCFFSSCTLSHICILCTTYMFSHPHITVEYVISCAVNIRLQLYTCFLTMRSKHASSEILNDIGRNSLLGNRKKVAKFLMRTFTCRSTFLYGNHARIKYFGDLEFTERNWEAGDAIFYSEAINRFFCVENRGIIRSMCSSSTPAYI
jgi:hypothetical protein